MRWRKALHDGVLRGQAHSFGWIVLLVDDCAGHRAESFRYILVAYGLRYATYPVWHGVCRQHVRCCCGVCAPMTWSYVEARPSVTALTASSSWPVQGADIAACPCALCATAAPLQDSRASQGRVHGLWSSVCPAAESSSTGSRAVELNGLG